LTPALELDSALIEFSGSLSSRNLPVRITTNDDLEKIMSALSDHIKTLHFWQYYVLDVNREKASVKVALSTKVSQWDGPDVAAKSVVELAEILRRCNKVQGLGKFASRFGVRVDGGVAASLVKAAFVDVGDEDGLAEAWARIVDVLNVPLYEEWEEDTRVALENIKHRVKYARLDEKGPRLGEITSW
jgi:glycogen debranching enzyme